MYTYYYYYIPIYLQAYLQITKKRKKVADGNEL